MKRKSLICIVTFFISLVSVSSQNELQLELYAEDLIRPVAIKSLDDNRLYVVEKIGRIQILTEGEKNEIPFLDIRDRVNSGASERGLLGMAFHPNYPDSPYVYVNYTDNSGGDTQISRFSLSDDQDVLDESSEKFLLDIDQPYSNHNGGDLSFGPDGYLYIGTGDGGSGGDPDNYGQNMTSLLGKMLRIDVNAGNQAYLIPPSNPYVNNSAVRDEIWASGLRNPWRFSFDRMTNDLWIADVGQSAKEEIDLQLADSPGGENYGWRCYEGTNTFNTNGCGNSEDYVFPVWEYGRNDGCSITGGYVYRASNFPELFGKYIYTDFCSGRIWALGRDTVGPWNNELLGNFFNDEFSSFGEDSNGEMYVCAYGFGRVYKLIPVCTLQAPSLNPQDGIVACTGDQVLLDGGPIPDGASYQWYKDSVLLSNENDRNLEVTADGEYSLLIQGPTCASGLSNEVAVEFIENPAIGELTFQDSMITADPGYSAYQWFKDSILIPDANTNILEVEGSGNYYCIIFDENGCSSTTNEIEVILSSLHNLLNVQTAKVYPNPFDHFILLRLEWLQFEAFTLDILDTSGRKHQSRYFNEEQLEYNISTKSLPMGTYILKLTFASGITTQFAVVKN